MILVPNRLESDWEAFPPHPLLQVRKAHTLPDDIDHEFILKFATPYIVPFVSVPSDWTPLKNLNKKYMKFGAKAPSENDLWQFKSFLVDERV